MVRRTAAGVAAVLALVQALALFSPPDAPAHQGNPDYESLVSGVQPEVEGLRARVLQNDDALLLEGRIERPLTVLGYEGEPMVRFLPGGRVLVNLNSPSHWNNFDRYGAEDLPARADPSARPAWKEVSTDGRYAWHDHRIHWMSKSIPPSIADESRRTKVFDYQVPIRTPEGAATIQGTLWWRGSGGPPLPLILVGAGILVGLAGGAVLLRRRQKGSAPANP